MNCLIMNFLCTIYFDKNKLPKMDFIRLCVMVIITNSVIVNTTSDGLNVLTQTQ